MIFFKKEVHLKQRSCFSNVISFIGQDIKSAKTEHRKETSMQPDCRDGGQKKIRRRYNRNQGLNIHASTVPARKANTPYPEAGIACSDLFYPDAGEHRDRTEVALSVLFE